VFYKVIREVPILHRLAVRQVVFGLHIKYQQKLQFPLFINICLFIEVVHYAYDMNFTNILKACKIQVIRVTETEVVC